MGYIRHHAILVTAPNYDVADAALIEAHAMAERIGCIASPITKKTVNGYRSFVVFPDGSKEGWEESDAGDARRKALVKWMDRQRYDDGSGPLRWVEVQYGDDEGQTLIVGHSDEIWRNKPGDLT